MQSGGQYGVPDVPQFVVGRVPSSTSAAASAHSHIFSLSSHDIPVENSSSVLHQQQDMVSTQQQQQKIRLESDSTQMVVPSTNPPNFINNTNTNTDICFDKQVVVPVSTENPNQQLVAVGGGGGGEDDTLDCERGSAGNRWPRQETLALLKIRSEMDANFRDASLKGPLWEEVSRRLAELGYYRSAKKCKEKFENVHKYYKRTKEGRAGRQDGKSYKFFSQLEALYGNNNITNHNAKINNNNSSSISNKVTVAAIGGGGIGSGAIGAAPIAVSTREIDNTPSTIKAAPQAPFRIERSSMDFSAFNFSTDTNSSEEESDDDQEDDSEQTDPNTRKRKRSTTSSMMAFFENLMKQVIEKQEAMQQKFLEAIEKREQDRMIREEAWKRQEMARLSREQELKSQERSLTASRDAALMTFLQKVTGETLQIPQLAATIQNVTLAPAPPPPPQPPENQQHNSDQEHQNHDKEIVPFDPNSMKRWPKPEVLALIKIRSGMEQKFHDAGPKGPLWEEISQGMACLGYIRSAKRCKEKWENINKYFRKAKESNKKRPENAKTCPYFHQLDALYRKKFLGNPSRQNKIMDHEYDGGSGGGHEQENKIIIHEDQNTNLIEQQQTRESNREENSPHSLQQGGSGGATNPDASSADILAIMPPPPPSEPVAYHHERSGSSTTARDNASFIAMVQKLASSADATDFNMSTSSNTE